MLQFEDLAIRQTGHVCNAWNVWAKLVHFWLAAMLHLENGDGDKDGDDGDDGGDGDDARDGGDGVDDDQPEDAEWGRAKPIARWLTRSHCQEHYNISVFDLKIMIVLESWPAGCKEVDDGDDKLLFAEVSSSFSHFYQISVNQVPDIFQ